MKNKSNDKVAPNLWAATVLVAMLLATGAGPVTAQSSAAPTAGPEIWLAPLTPIEATLDIDHLPALGAAATLICRVNTVEDAPATHIQIELPEGVHFQSGALTWDGDLQVGSPVELTATVTFDTPGNVAIACRALRPVDADNTWGDLGELYLSIDQATSALGFAPVSNASRVTQGASLETGSGQTVETDPGPIVMPVRPEDSVAPPAIEPALEAGATAAASEPQTEGTLTVTGNWQYYDRSDNLVNALEMQVELVNGDDYSHLAWCRTDPIGNYSCGPATNPGSAGVRTILWTYTIYGPYDNQLAVVNPDWGLIPSTSNTYGVHTNAVVFSDGTQSIGSWYLPNGNNFERAFWVQRDLLEEYRYIWFGAGVSQSPQETSGPATVQWKIDSNDGTYYSDGGNIHLKGDDPLSDSVVGHEYGHNIMYTIYGNTFPMTNCPSPHYFQGYSHPNCAWTEGWANFITLATKNEPVYRWSSGASANIETPTWGTANWDSGEGVEGRVAGALWDILDTANDGSDQYSDGGIVNIWDTIYHQTDNRFSEYWSAWKARGHNNANAVQSIYQNTIDYRGGSNIVDHIVPNDFDGDGDSDVAVYRPSTGVWYVKDQFQVGWGASNDIPVPGDYDNDGDTDVAVYRPSTGVWYVRNQYSVGWGIPGDIPVPGDYDKDGDTDVAVYRPSTGVWYVKDQFSVGWGISNDIPVPGDYDNDGDTDVAVYRPSNGMWYIKDQLQTGWGISSDIPVQGDYNGDGRTDVAVYRPSTGVWYVKDQFQVGWGASSDRPIPADYDKDGRTDVAVYRPSNGVWYVRDQFQVGWGVSSDFPLAARWP